MTGKTKYYHIPFTKTTFFIEWWDGKFKRVGFRKPMNLAEAIMRLERKRMWREEKDLIDLQQYEQEEQANNI